jgi:dimethylglycine dehydrogenase
MNLAYAFLDPDLSTQGTKLQLDMYGDLVGAEVIASSPYDPTHKLMRS